MARDPDVGTSDGQDGAPLPDALAAAATPEARTNAPLIETPDGGETPASERRIAFERLRERTDELELIVSGLLALSLLTLPSWLFDGWVRASAHAEGLWQIVLMMGYMFGSGLSYTLGVTFIIHLAVRAYWVGLIGLKATFPKGIRWDSISTVGPIARDYHQRRLPDLMSVIDRADRAASMLFALATLIALLILWSSLGVVVLVTVGALLGWLFDLGQTALILSMVGVYTVLMMVAVAIMMTDAFLARRRPALQQSPRLRRLVFGTLRFYGWILPQRLILPVQLTLQSNLSGRAYTIAFMVIMFVAPMVGVVHVLASRNFALTGSYHVLDTDTIEYGQASAHYEDQRGEHDRLLRYPMIPSDRIGGSYLRLFLPHLPERDNAELRERCPTLFAADPAPPSAQAAAARAACLAGLWTLTLDGQPASASDFMASERRDLGLRGLQGYLPTAGLAPGRHDLLAIWNADGAEDGPQRRREYRIPFWFAPEYELQLPDAAPP
jgi:hypothetical protein